MMFYKILSTVFLFVFTLSSASYAGIGAGVLPLFDDGTILMGKETRSRPRQAPHYVWGDFGGKQDPGESISQTALREFKEETAHYSFPHVSLAQVENAPYVDHIHKVGTYRMHFVSIHGSKPSIQEIVKNAKKAHQKLGRHAHVEKVEWRYVSAQEFLNAVMTNAPFPGTNEEIFAPLKAGIMQPTAQNVLQQCIISAQKKPVAAKKNAKPVAAKKNAKPVVAKKSAAHSKKSKKPIIKKSKKAKHVKASHKKQKKVKAALKKQKRVKAALKRKKISLKKKIHSKKKK